MTNSSVKTVLVFAYYWPPASGPGVQRWLKFIKFLSEKGWNAIVVTPENGSYPNTDPTLLEDVPKKVQIERTKTLEPFRAFNLITGQASRGNTTSVGMGEIKGPPSLVKKISSYIRANFFIPDARKGWRKFAIKKAEKIIADQKIDLIVTTGPPHSAHLIGMTLKKKFSIPWIADFRDPWTNIYYNKFLPRTKGTVKKDTILETNVLKQANATIVVSKSLKIEFQNRAKKIQVIENGYDENDFLGLQNSNEKTLFRLSYIGNLKDNQNCTILWEVIKELSEKEKDFSELFRLSFTGNLHPDVIHSLEEYGLLNITEILPFVPHEEAIKRMINAQALLFLIPNSPSNKQIITGKIFEYLASRTPLLSIGPVDGDAAEILETCKRSTMIDYSNKQEMKKELLRLFRNWKNSDRPSVVTNNNHKIYSRRNLTFQLADLFEEVVQ